MDENLLHKFKSLLNSIAFSAQFVETGRHPLQFSLTYIIIVPDTNINKSTKLYSNATAIAASHETWTFHECDRDTSLHVFMDP
jgi:hypothetical protein